MSLQCVHFVSSVWLFLRRKSLSCTSLLFHASVAFHAENPLAWVEFRSGDFPGRCRTSIPQPVVSSGLFVKSRISLTPKSWASHQPWYSHADRCRGNPSIGLSVNRIASLGPYIAQARILLTGADAATTSSAQIRPKLSRPAAARLLLLAASGAGRTVAAFSIRRTFFFASPARAIQEWTRTRTGFFISSYRRPLGQRQRDASSASICFHVKM